MNNISTEGKLLGKNINIPNSYTSEILVAVPRYLNREQYNILEASLPFKGYDVWHAYEVSFLTDRGMPVVGILKIVYPCDSKFLVESKSVKLYLNSFNMEKMGKDKTEAADNFLEIVSKDLSLLLKTSVKVYLHFDYTHKIDNSEYVLLEAVRELQEEDYLSFQEDKSLLLFKDVSDDENTFKIASRLLRSNCKITNQPDWGNVYIHIKTDKNISFSGVLKYIVSIRNENHFHEEICEMIYVRLKEAFQPSELFVSCMYTRRGGVDICPVRVSDDNLIQHLLCDVEKLTYPDFRQ